VVCESEVIIDTPANHFFAIENHAIAERALQFGEHIAAFCHISVLTQGAGLFEDSFE
jgi:hypothetical protein